MSVPLTSPVTGTEWAFASASGGADGVSGSPGTTDAHTKHFERAGFEIVEVAASEIPARSNDAKDVAFCIVDDDELDGTIKASDPIAVFARADDDMTIGLGGHFDGAGRLLQTEDRAEGVELRGFGVDARQSGKGANLSLNRGAHLRDITIRGEGDSAQEWGCGIYAKVPRGESVVLENVNQPAGASRNTGEDSTEDSIGVLLNGESNGVIELHHCTFGGFPNNGLYAEPWKHNNDGYAKVYDHVGYNSDRDQLRVGGRSLIENPTLYVDESKPGFNNHRGIWFKAAQGARVTGGTIKTFPGNDPGSAIRLQSSAGRVTIRDLDVELRGTNDAARGIEAHSPNGDIDDSLLTVDGAHFHGDASPKQVVLVQEGRRFKYDDITIDEPLVSNAGVGVDVR